ncbi:S-layer homology domain-containing protein [Lysinibacillus sp. RC79]|uniref:S-layer homology domain-containing protein n=1 Tax=Lysinibacillus sp. RC79 TaxID=3156296 RepID=UPI003516B2FD
MANQPKKYKKFVASAATATLVATAIAPFASAAGFTDIADNTHKEAIIALSEAGIINGYADGTFKPNQTINRGQVVKLLGRWLETEGYEAPADWATKQYFNDLPLTAEKELLKYAALTKDAGVFAGSNGNLNYTQSMQRQQMAVVLVRAINEIYDLDLVKEYKAEKFKSEISDLDKAFSAEQREAITALDYAELTDAAKQANKAFNPANSITRGQFASFLNRTINIDVEVGVDASVKAINSTTVEVTFDEEVDTDNVKAENFKIEGLEVKNASVKQTNKKVVVLTTAAQTADKEYTVSYKGEEIGKFKGIAAVIPTTVKLTTASEQGVIGKEVTLKATVTVPEGQSKENVPVTFNIVNDKNTNEKIEKVAYTNAEGVATYSYTRYYASVDSVTAYATDKSTVFSSAKVYWANETQLAITEKTADNVLSNGAKKVYEISAPQKAGQYVFVAFENNLGVTTDKLTRSVFVEGTGLWTQNTTNNITETPATTDQYPYEITNGANRVVPVLLDSKGKANLVLSGTNGKVKPVVYAGELKTNYNFYNNNNPGSKITDFANVLYNPTALQAKAAEVSFDIKHTLGLTIEAKGVANAAVALTGKETGGRDYVATYVDKDGKPAKAGDQVLVALAYDAKHPTYLVDEDGKELDHYLPRQDGNTYYSVPVKGKEGKVEFTVTSKDEQAFAEPIVFINNGTGPDKNKSILDASDLQAKGAATYFTKEIQYKAELEALDAKGDDTKSVLAGGSEFVEYKYNLVDQNGKPRAYKTATNVSFNVTAGTSELTVTGATEGTVKVAPGNPRTVTTTIAAGELSKSIKVTADKAGSVTAYATASRVGAGVLPSTDSLTVTFNATSNVVKTGKVTKVEKEVVYIDGVPYSLLDATYLNNGTVVPTLQAFKADYLKDGATVTVSKDKDGKLTFNVVPANSNATLGTAIKDAKNLVATTTEGTNPGQYPSKAALNTAIDNASKVYNDALATATEIANAEKTLADAVKAYQDSKIESGSVLLAKDVKDAEDFLKTVKSIPDTDSPAAGQIKAAEYKALSDQITLAKAVLADTASTEANYTAAKSALKTALDNAKAQVTAYETAKTALNKSITDANTAHKDAVTGAASGQYSSNDKAVLKVAIDAAQAVYNDAAKTTAQLTTAKTDLDSAKTIFAGTVIAHTIKVGGTDVALSLTFTSNTGVVLTSGATVTVDAANTTATVASTSVGADDILTINVTAPVSGNVIVVPVTVNGQVVKFTVTFDGTDWTVTKQDPANFVKVVTTP